MALKEAQNNQTPWWKPADADPGIIVPHDNFYRTPTKKLIVPIEATGARPLSPHHDPNSGSNPNALHPDDVEHGDIVAGTVKRGTRRTAG